MALDDKERKAAGMSGLIREDPGEATKLSIRYADDLAKVKTEPGEWFRLAEYGSGSQAHKVALSLGQAHKVALSLGQQTAGQGFEFRATTRGLAGRGRVYVRWVGP